MLDDSFMTLEMKSREERSNQYFTEDQSIFSNNATSDTWLLDSGQTNVESWCENEHHQDSVLVQLDDPEDRMKFALEREEQIGSIVQSITDLRHVFKVRDTNFLVCISNILNDNFVQRFQVRHFS